MLHVQHPNLETGWLARRQKDIPRPEIVILDGPCDVAGLYYHPLRTEECFDGVYVERDRGIIMLWAGTDVGTLAHEWRHHEQWWAGWSYDGSVWNADIGLDAWPAAVSRYFRTSRSELDALRFELTVAPADSNAELADLVFASHPATNAPPGAGHHGNRTGQPQEAR